MYGRLTIGQLANEVGVPASTLRYYERAELLEPAGRTEGNYRVYSHEALERVQFIKAAQGGGFSLDDIRALLEVRDGVTSPCPEVEQLIMHRLSEIRNRLKDLREVERHLKRSLSVCRESSERDHCQVLDALSERSAKT